MGKKEDPAKEPVVGSTRTTTQECVGAKNADVACAQCARAEKGNACNSHQLQPPLVPLFGAHAVFIGASQAWQL
eukprot:162272-Ditylum_brightwellii.AAC.1